MRKNFLDYIHSTKQSPGISISNQRYPYMEQPEIFIPLIRQMDVVLILADYRTGSFPYVSENSNTILGIKPEQLKADGLIGYVRHLEVDDQSVVVRQMFPDFLDLSRELNPDELYKTKFCFCYRLMIRGKIQMIKHSWTILELNDRKEPIVTMSTLQLMDEPIKSGILLFRQYQLCQDKGWKQVNQISYKTSGPHDHLKKLSATELKVLELIHKGMTSKQAGTQLNLSHETVNRHRKNIIKKFKASNAMDAVRIAREAGII
ncbi:MAG: helix-turn-helix transcriptional regulator [Flavobacteriales bacterium]|nr:helix-turn-helix transcriptional regulator [Flavobacteriales bacterium]